MRSPMFVTVLALTWAVDVSTNTCNDPSKGGEGHDETGFVQHRLVELLHARGTEETPLEMERDSLEEPIDDALEDLFREIHQEVRDSGVQDPKQNMSKSPSEESNDALDEIERSVNELRDEISQAT